MKIDSKLNLVVPVDGESEGKVYFHSTPILRETFERYHFVIAAAFTRLLEGGMQLTGAAIAAMTLQEVAEDMGRWENKTVNGKTVPGIKEGLMQEIERLTNVLCWTAEGWKTFPVNIAIQRQFIDEETWGEAKQRIVFFTLVCMMTRLAVMADLLTIMNDSWQTQTTSLTCTEYAGSLPTLSEIETSAAKQLSIPT